MATVAARGSREESFYQKMAVGLALFILFSFGQFAARGMVGYRRRRRSWPWPDRLPPDPICPVRKRR